MTPKTSKRVEPVGETQEGKWLNDVVEHLSQLSAELAQAKLRRAAWIVGVAAELVREDTVKPTRTD